MNGGHPSSELRAPLQRIEGTPPINWRGALKLEGTPPVDGGHPSSREGKGMGPLHSLHRLKISKSQDYLTDIGYVHGGVRSPYSGRDTALFAAASDELHGPVVNSTRNQAGA